MNHSEMTAVRAEMVAAIMGHADPATWLQIARKIAEAMGLNSARCLPLGVALDAVCFAVVEEAGKQRKTAEQVREAIARGVR